MGLFLLRAAFTGLALWVVTLIVPGIRFVGGDTKLHIDRFWWTAIWAAILLSIVSWVLSLAASYMRRTVRQYPDTGITSL